VPFLILVFVGEENLILDAVELSDGCWEPLLDRRDVVSRGQKQLFKKREYILSKKRLGRTTIALHCLPFVFRP
jgi:hypothetical protein